MIYKNALITTKDEQFLGWIEIDENKILKSINKGKTNLDGFDCKKNILMPGFIETHLHGGYGFSLDDLDNEKNYKNFLFSLKKEGVVAFLGASVTSSIEKLENDLIKIKNKIDNNYVDMPKMLGWYYEGPFISKEKKGAHEEKLIISINEEFLNKIKDKLFAYPIVLTVDAENKNNLKLIKKYQNDFIFALGHSNATYENATYSLKSGIKRITHLYNAMSGFHHSNQIGIVNAIFNKEYKNDIAIELIADGVHVSNEVILFTYKNINIDNINVITDSLPPKGLIDGNYKLGNLDIEKRGNWCYLKNQTTLAGSAVSYNWILSNFKKVTNCSWSEVVKISSYNSARNLKLDSNYGDFVIGKKINFVLVDENINVIETFI